MRVLIALVAIATLAGCLGSERAPPVTDDAAADAPVEMATYKTSFAGQLPNVGADAIGNVHTVDIPEGATEMTVILNRTYTGAWGSVLFVDDPFGNERIDYTQECPFGLNPGVQASESCTMQVPGSIDEGTWVIELVWQVGEVNESYNIDVLWVAPAGG